MSDNCRDIHGRPQLTSRFILRPCEYGNEITLEQEELKFVHVPKLGTRLFGRADPPNIHSDALGERLIIVQTSATT
uniref:Velvet domain-containing protein n=2 Tax=Bursaphelenchus xylophilus TaxID=6326 RepID=A0A1I7SHC1_BURXY